MKTNTERWAGFANERGSWAMRAYGLDSGRQGFAGVSRALPLGVAEWQQDAFPVQVSQAAQPEIDEVYAEEAA